MDLSAKKDTVRRLVLARRARVDGVDREVAARAVADAVLALPELRGDEPVIGFVSIRSEIGTEPLLRALVEAGRALLLPYVAEDGTLQAAPVRSLEELDPGYRGIPEPRARLPVDPASAGAVIVPGVAFDEAGRRLGYGGGFYDRFLARCGAAPRIGICFELQVVDEVPAAEWDEQVDVVVTEQRVVRATTAR